MKEQLTKLDLYYLIGKIEADIICLEFRRDELINDNPDADMSKENQEIEALKKLLEILRA